jgi:hypothetical protein
MNGNITRITNIKTDILKKLFKKISINASKCHLIFHPTKKFYILCVSNKKTTNLLKTKYSSDNFKLFSDLAKNNNVLIEFDSNDFSFEHSTEETEIIVSVNIKDLVMAFDFIEDDSIILSIDYNRTELDIQSLNEHTNVKICVCNNDMPIPIAKLFSDSNEYINENKCILKIITTQTAALKEVLKIIGSLISECNIIFKNTDDIKKTCGMYLTNLTEDKTTLMKLCLDGKNFEHFYCDKPKISFCVDVRQFISALELFNDDEPITLCMNEFDENTLFIMNDDKNTKIESIDKYCPEFPVPVTEFQNKITMSTDKFNSICKRFYNNSNFVHIGSTANGITFGNGSVKILCDNFTVAHHTGEFFENVYDLRQLINFSGCQKISNTVEIYLKNDFPLVLVFWVATLGKMYIFLSPIESQK